MTVLNECYQCQKRPMEPRERAGGVFFECKNCDSPNGIMPDARPDEYPPMKED